ncbi:MAG: hypothetical protein DWQ31_16270 [Planctomycetota bacterium]|nr:MAG: hypothetical protein DWQ31_16270 [Planctomycetota bacterium]REJ87603.1 MAG: hypothetical protein DWQ35_21045 [Planctomycetota bacterium]REK30153.1 MAG: hypothetical protein DWQ42_01875 [Planctomycetota bacterium]REK43320.1 MAG: hypothetical protein DWQ46_11920 [Planctomycetota bacterium]
MRAVSRVLSIALVLVAVTSGCQQGGLVPPPVYQGQPVVTGQAPVVTQPQLGAMPQQQLQSRISSLDRINEETERQLADSRQQRLLLENQLASRQAELDKLRDRLKTTTAQLVQARDQATAAEQRAQQAIAATRSRGGAVITANNSLNQQLPQWNLPGVTVARDADVVRVRIASSSLFGANSATLAGGATSTLDRIASELARTYPDQIIGIEGHTDNSQQQPGGPWVSNHHLSTAQAMAVYNHLIGAGLLRSGQLHVAGHGANHPLYSNTSAEARAANRRIEVVVYPERASGR